MGRAYLYALPVDERKVLLLKLRRQWRRDDWASILARIEGAFDSIGRRGFCVSLGDRRPDVYAAAAPIITPDGTVTAINCGGLPSEATADFLENELGPRLADAASQLSAEAYAHA